MPFNYHVYFQCSACLLQICFLAPTNSTHNLPICYIFKCIRTKISKKKYIRTNINQVFFRLYVEVKVHQNRSQYIVRLRRSIFLCMSYHALHKQMFNFTKNYSSFVCILYKPSKYRLVSEFFIPHVPQYPTQVGISETSS